MTRQIMGVLGSIFAALCCIGTPALLAFLASIGLGFLINDLILFPLLFVFLAISIWGLKQSMDTHRQRWPFVLAVVSGVMIFTAVWVSPLVVLFGIVGLIVASVWNIYLLRTCVQARDVVNRTPTS